MVDVQRMQSGPLPVRGMPLGAMAPGGLSSSGLPSLGLQGFQGFPPAGLQGLSPRYAPNFSQTGSAQFAPGSPQQAGSAQFAPCSPLLSPRPAGANVYASGFSQAGSAQFAPGSPLVTPRQINANVYAPAPRATTPMSQSRPEWAGPAAERVDVYQPRPVEFLPPPLSRCSPALGPPGAVDVYQPRAQPREQSPNMVFRDMSPPPRLAPPMSAAGMPPQAFFAPASAGVQPASVAAAPPGFPQSMNVPSPPVQMAAPSAPATNVVRGISAPTDWLVNGGGGPLPVTPFQAVPLPPRSPVPVAGTPVQRPPQQRVARFADDPQVFSVPSNNNGLPPKGQRRVTIVSKEQAEFQNAVMPKAFFQVVEDMAKKGNWTPSCRPKAESRLSVWKGRESVEMENIWD